MKGVIMTVALALTIILPGGCKCRGGETPQKQKEYRFTLPSIPKTITDPTSRANYLIEHYWDNFNFADTAYVDKPEITEQAFVDYIDTMPYAANAYAKRSIESTLSKAEKEESGRMYGYFLDLFNKYTYDPNAPYLNEELYLAVAEHIIADKVSDPAAKKRAGYNRDMILKNRMGTPAEDFTYTLDSGRKGNLYGIKSDYTLVYFNNPGCHACSETTKAIISSRLMQGMTKEGKLAVLAFYPDKEIDAWREHTNDFSKEWINGYDSTERFSLDKIYDLRAIPSLYLLDRDKKVILKDAPFGVVEAWLTNYR